MKPRWPACARHRVRAKLPAAMRQLEHHECPPRRVNLSEGFGPWPRSERTVMSHLDTIAKRKVSGPEGWVVCGWKLIGDGNDLVVEGGVPRLLKAGPNKGSNTWRDVSVQKAVVTGEELKAEHARYEADTGKCGDCYGKGEGFASWHHVEGTKYGKCKRCGGTGKRPNEKLNGPNGLQEQPGPLEVRLSDQLGAVSVCMVRGSVADQCRALGLKVGDTIEGTEGGAGWWNTTRLTLLWLGETLAAWSVTDRSSSRPNWSEPCEAANWSLSCRDWRKVGAERTSQPRQ
jgi:hypothetical protein